MTIAFFGFFTLLFKFFVKVLIFNFMKKWYLVTKK